MNLYDRIRQIEDHVKNMLAWSEPDSPMEEEAMKALDSLYLLKDEVPR